MTKPILAFVACLLFPMAIHAQSAPFDMTPQQLANPDNEPAYVFPVPTRRQMNWQKPS